MAHRFTGIIFLELTPCGRFRLQNLLMVHLVKKLSVFYGIVIFNTVFTTFSPIAALGKINLSHTLLPHF